MKRLIPILLLMFFSASVMAEPIELTCNDNENENTKLIIDLERNTLQYGVGYPAEIYFKDMDYIIWVDHLTNVHTILTAVLERKTGVLKWSVFEYAPKGDATINVYPHEEQCFKSI